MTSVAYSKIQQLQLNYRINRAVLLLIFGKKDEDMQKYSL